MARHSIFLQPLATICARDTSVRFCLSKVMTHVVDALGRDKGPDLDRIALAMVDVATKVGSDEAVSKD